MSVKPVFLLYATLMIPKVTIKPSIEDVQEALVTAGKYMTNVSKGVGQWTGGKEKQVPTHTDCVFHLFSYLLFLFFFSFSLFSPLGLIAALFSDCSEVYSVPLVYCTNCSESLLYSVVPL